MSQPFAWPSTAQTDSFVRDRLPPAAQWPELRYDTPELAALASRSTLNVVHELLDRATEKGLDANPCLRSPYLTLSYAEVRERVNRISRVLVEDWRLVPGNRVLLRGGNSIGLALAWLAVVKAGLIAVGTMPLLRAKELGEILEKAQIAHAICDARLLDELEKATPASGLKTLLYNTGTLNSQAPPHPLDLGALTKSKAPSFDAIATRPGDIALLAFTSGTTGQPKAAVHTHLDVLAACEAWPRHVLQARPSDIVVGSPPLAFTFGLGGLLVFPLWEGASVYFHDAPYTPESMVDAINQTGATICYTAPTFYRQMAPFAKAKGVPSLRLSVSAGEGLPPATRQLWREASGLDMLDGIGATEMFHIFISSRGEDLSPSPLGTPIGRVVPGYEARVVDENGSELPRGSIGRLAVRGCTGCKYMADERQAAYVQGGWNFPGDAFVQDEKGLFFYQARADDMIITSGYNVAGPEVEDALLKHPSVAECAVVGKPDEERGMIVKAYVVLKPGNDPGPEQAKRLQDHVKVSIAPFKYPREISFLNALPRTETGKLQRFRLRQQAQAETQP